MTDTLKSAESEKPISVHYCITDPCIICDPRNEKCSTCHYSFPYCTCVGEAIKKRTKDMLPVEPVVLNYRKENKSMTPSKQTPTDEIDKKIADIESTPWVLDNREIGVWILLQLKSHRMALKEAKGALLQRKEYVDAVDAGDEYLLVQHLKHELKKAQSAIKRSFELGRIAAIDQCSKIAHVIGCREYNPSTSLCVFEIMKQIDALLTPPDKKKEEVK